MKYIMKAGALYSENGQMLLARLKGALNGPEKRIYSADGREVMRTTIRKVETVAEAVSDIHNREYVLYDSNGTEYAIAKPEYAKGEDPAVVGWPISRMPRVDHAHVRLFETQYLLVMQNNQNYALFDVSGKMVIQILHKGIAGGWRFQVGEFFSAELLCGVFAFCRYIEQENEFIII